MSYMTFCHNPLSLICDSQNPHRIADSDRLIKAKTHHYALLDRCIANPNLKSFLAHPALENAWKESLNVYATPWNNQTFIPQYQPTLKPFDQVLANYWWAQLCIYVQKQAGKTIQTAWDPIIEDLASKAATAGSFRALLEIHRQRLNRMLLETNVQRADAHFQELVTLLEPALKIHGTPAYLLLAELSYYFSLKTETDPQLTTSLRLQTLTMVQVAKILEPASTAAIHNAYFGEDIKSALAQKIALGRSLPLDFSDWDQFIRELTKVVFPAVDNDTLTMLANSIRSDAQRLVSQSHTTPVPDPVFSKQLV
jgi:hypothetical protein